MNYHGKKTLLFIEPCLSSYPLVLKAKEKGYTTLVLSAPSEHGLLPEEVLNASSSFFQLNITNDVAVFDLVRKIAQKFYIDGVIPGAEYYVPLAAKVALYLDRPGLIPESALGIQRKDLMHNRLKTHGLPVPKYVRVEKKEELKVALKEIKFPCVIKPLNCNGAIKAKKVNTNEEAFIAFEGTTSNEDRNSCCCNYPLQKGALIEEYIQGKAYSVQGFLKENAVHIVSIMEKLFSLEPHLVEKGHIIHSEIDSEFFTMLEAFLRKVISALKLNYGPFEAKVRISEKGPILMKITMHLESCFTPKFIEYATGIDYYDNTLKLLSGQPLFLHKTQDLNTGVIFFDDLSKLESVQNSPHLKELKIYDKEAKLGPQDSSGRRKLGHAIFAHKDYEILKQQMEGVVVRDPLMKN